MKEISIYQKNKWVKELSSLRIKKSIIERRMEKLVSNLKGYLEIGEIFHETK